MKSAAAYVAEAGQFLHVPSPPWHGGVVFVSLAGVELSFSVLLEAEL